MPRAGLQSALVVPEPIEAVPITGAMCPAHEGAPAVGVCSRCGTFICGRCQRVGRDARWYCPACEQPDLVLANRGTRLAAAMLDGFLAAGALWTFMLPVSGRESPFEVLAALIGAGVLGVQLYLCASSSQSIGKRLLQIQVVRLDGSRASVVRIVLLRNVIPQALSAAVSFVGLIDAAFIFGDARRCLHDYLADTMVVKVLPPTAPPGGA